MRRRFVQLTSNFSYAQAIANQTPSPVVFQILREQALADGIRFFETGTHVWVSDAIPADLLQCWLTGSWDVTALTP
jgi:RNA:NAD 2'-phosphotransferase (TPT1/KptA family)